MWFMKLVAVVPMVHTLSRMQQDRYFPRSAQTRGLTFCLDCGNCNRIQFSSYDYYQYLQWPY